MNIDYRDIGGGAVLILVGGGIAAYAYLNYNIGTVWRMGPGMFPMGAGAVLAVLGFMVVLPALFRRGEPINVMWKPFLIVLSSILAFALIITPFGLIPAVVTLVAISSLAGESPNFKRIVILAVALNILAILVFRLALNLPITLFRWPF